MKPVNLLFTYFLATAAPFWFGVLSGHYAARGPAQSIDPDTYIHAGIAIYSLGIFVIWIDNAWRARKRFARQRRVKP